jgi:hypothetical protein
VEYVGGVSLLGFSDGGVGGMPFVVGLIEGSARLDTLGLWYDGLRFSVILEGLFLVDSCVLLDLCLSDS